MLFHLSINAHDPDRVAAVLAEILDAKVVKAPPPVFNEGALLVCCGDERGTLVVVEPWGVTYRPGPDASLDSPVGDDSPEYTSFHGLFEAKVDVDTIGKIADREGWPWGRADYGLFRVVNVWLEGRQLLEFVTEDMIPDYLGVFASEGLIAGA
ncbi:MAG TPA: hypothetical protein VFZ17_04515 [Acidimicrobiia bacterium]|nr:hypothetical protein [Acidimicrobiia bacterium]